MSINTNHFSTLKKSEGIYVKQNHDLMYNIEPIAFMFNHIIKMYSTKILFGDNVKFTKIIFLWIKSQCFKRSAMMALKY